MPTWTGSSWQQENTPVSMCQCGHRWHTSRCQPAPFGCPCYEHKESKAQPLDARRRADYYDRIPRNGE